MESDNRLPQANSYANHKHEFHAVFRHAHALAMRLVASRFRGNDRGLQESMRYALEYQTPSDYPYLLKYSFCRNQEDGAPIARILAAVHLLQTSTMVTDDIFDASNLRYGRSVLHRKYGISQAVIVAELFQSMALESISRELEKYRFPNACRVFALLNRIVAECYAGQHLDIATSGDLEINIREYYRVIRLCAGNFFAHLAACGALLADRKKEEVNSLARFGYNYGMGLFITDDIVDIADSPTLTGKSLSPDLKGRRMRLPMILALRLSTASTARLLRDFLRSPDVSRADTLGIAKLIRHSGALEACKATAQAYLNRAKKALVCVETPLTRHRLAWLCDSLFNAQGL
jgi:geranylgeranyl pyrophosphate synthase